MMKNNSEITVRDAIKLAMFAYGLAMVMPICGAVKTLHDNACKNEKEKTEQPVLKPE